jgi:hypothetical protein
MYNKASLEIGNIRVVAFTNMGKAKLDEDKALESA